VIASSIGTPSEAVISVGALELFPGETMTEGILDRLLATLDVRVHAFAVCHVQKGWRLVFAPMNAVSIHYVLSGHGVLRVGNGTSFPFGPHSILRVFGQSASVFIQRVRLRQAAHLLGTTDLPIKIIANSVGYASRSHFSRAFRNFYSVDPRAYLTLQSLTDEPAPPDAFWSGHPDRREDP